MALSAGLHLQASAQTFNKRFDLFGEMRSQTAWAVEVRPDSSALIVFNGSYSTADSVYSSGICTVVVDASGQFSSEFRLHLPGHNSYPGWVNCAVSADTGGYFCFGTTENFSDTSRLAVFSLGVDGGVEAIREVPLENGSWIARGGLQTADGGFLLVGEYYPGPGFDALLAKTNSQGELEWYRTYGEPDLRESLTSIVPAPWGGYYIGGQKELAPWQWHSWVLRVDSLGGVLSDQTYTVGQYASGGAQLTLAPNGNVWVASAEAEGPGDYSYQAALYEVDTAGDLVWHEQIGHIYRSVLFSVQQVPGSTDLISAGFDDRTNLVQPIMGTLLRTTSTGDSLWMRSYAYHDELVDLGNAGFYDMQPTPDGGFIAVGFAEANWQQGPGGWEQIYSRDVWVVKTDSMGCLEPGCHLIMGMESQITNLRDALSVAPNPLASGGMVHVSVKLPESFTPQGPLRLTVMSSDGRIVQERTMPSGVSAFSLQLSDFPTGLYHLHLHDATRWISGAKLMVE